MKLEIKVPSVGESVTEGDIGSWEKKSGDFVKKGEVLLVLETDKASMEIPAEKDGVLSILRQNGEKVSVGEVLGFIDTNASENSSSDPTNGSEIPSTQSIKEQRIEARTEWETLKTERVKFNRETQNIKQQADRKYAQYKNQFPDNEGLKTNAEKLYQKVKEREEQLKELKKEEQSALEKWNKLKAMDGGSWSKMGENQPEKDEGGSRSETNGNQPEKDENQPEIGKNQLKTSEGQLEIDEKQPKDSLTLQKSEQSPSVRRLLESNTLNPSDIKGTGRGGRLTKEDILIALEEGPKDFSSIPLQKESPVIPESPSGVQTSQRREPMTRLRKTTAERLVQSQQSTATLSTFNEVDLSRIIEIRKNYQEEFIQKHGIKLGFMSFFVRAVVAGLKEYPRLNAFIEGTDIVYNNHQHIGIAVSTEKGLVVPVIFYAETLNLAGIEKKILEYKDKALSRKLIPDDLIGGTFSISNGGVFGSLLSTPILNPPQSGILGMHKIEERPIAINGKVEIRPMMYVTLSYDHRIVDGRESVGFLLKVKEGLEEPARLLMDI